MAIEKRLPYPDSRVTCSCGETFNMWWNGGELDRHDCRCGRTYTGEHAVTYLIVENPALPDGVRCPECGGELDAGFVGDARAGDEHFARRVCYGCGWHDKAACEDCQRRTLAV